MLSARDRVHLGRIGQPAWRMFLLEEGCAAAVLQRLRAADLVAGMPADARVELETLATGETQRCLSAKAQLRDLARIAQRRGWTPVILKGGVAVAEGIEPIQISDLDVLVPENQLLELAGELRALGYGGGEERGRYHLAPSVAAGVIPIEIHRRWDRDATGVDPEWWDRTEPLVRHEPLRRAGAVDYLWHILVHVTEHHAELRGRVRDLLFIRHTVATAASNSIGDASPTDLEVRIAAHPMAEAMRTTLRAAGALGSEAAHDPFDRRAAARYVLHVVSERFGVPAVIRGQLIALTISVADGPRDLGYYARRVIPSIWRFSGPDGRPHSTRGVADAVAMRVVRRAAVQFVVAAIAPVLAILARLASSRAKRQTGR